MTQQQMKSNPTYQQPLCTSCAADNESNTTTTRKRDVNETKTTADDTVRCTPQKRFPEFQNAGEWRPVILKDIGNTYNGLSGKNSGDFGTGEPYVAYKQVFNGTTIKIEECPLVVIKDGEKQNKLKKGDILVTISSETAQEIGMVNVITEDFKKSVYLNSFCFIFRPHNNCFVPSFAKYLFNSPSYRKQIISIAQGITRYNLSKDSFLKLTVYIPALQEQQKIASCLQSIDDDIFATTQKMEQLKTHKKALLQKLFPQRGKSIPELRFPEFQNAKEWESKRLGEITTSFSGGTPLVTKKEYYDGDIPFIRSGEINNSSTKLCITELGLKNSSAKIIEKGALLYALYGATSGEVAISKIRGAINQAVLAIIPQDDINVYFLYQYLRASKKIIVNNFIQGGQGNLSSMIINSLPILVPSLEEQQKIANCLRPIDDNIYATTDKLEFLQKLKKALMQQLFPHL